MLASLLSILADLAIVDFFTDWAREGLGFDG